MFIVLMIALGVQSVSTYALLTLEDISNTQLQATPEHTPLSTLTATASNDDCCEVECCENECACPGNTCVSFIYLSGQHKSPQAQRFNERVPPAAAVTQQQVVPPLYRPPIFAS